MKNGKRTIRVLLAKPGLDGHDRGVYLVAQALRDAGIEVIFLGLQTTAEEVVAAALQEDVDMVGLSIFSGGHMTILPRITEKLRQAGLGELPVIVGGIIPPDDARTLKGMGIHEVFPPGCSTADIITCVRSLSPVT